MRKFYFFQAVFFICYALWSGHNYVVAHRQIKMAQEEAIDAKAFNAQLIMQLPINKLSNLGI